MTTVSIVIPFIDSWDITSKSIELLARYTKNKTELILIDNGSAENYQSQFQDIVNNSNLFLKYIKNAKNICALPALKQGFEATSADIICFMHNDVLIHEDAWDDRLISAFDNDPQLGLAGLFGAKGVHPNGGRYHCTSHMLGKIWGACGCHDIAAIHHGELMTAIAPSVVFDSLAMFFSKQALSDLIYKTDSFAEWRSPSHFYDRFLSIKVLDLGYHMATIGIAFDHYGGGTSGSSPQYREFLTEWLTEHGYTITDENLDIQIYKVAESQWLEEFGSRLPVVVDDEYNLLWENIQYNNLSYYEQLQS